MQPSTPLENAFRLRDNQKKELKKLGLITVRDLLFHFPARYEDIANIKRIKDLEEGASAIVYGKVLSTNTTRAYRKKIPIGEAVIEDDTGKLQVTWFNQAYAAKMLTEGDFVKLSGHINRDKNGKLYMGNPEFKKTSTLPIDVGDSLFAGEAEHTTHLPIYPERRGITSRWIYHSVQKIFTEGVLDQLVDPIPENIRNTYNLPKLKTALVWIHTPQKASDAESAKKRFAFEEIFFIQLHRQKARAAYKSHGSFAIDTSKEDIDHFASRFPFTPTHAQTRAVEAIRTDLAKNEPMTRLLEGDVGSGKTFVAAASCYAVVSTHLRASVSDVRASAPFQVAYMAPTEILAEQHFESFIEQFKGLPIQIGLITGSGCKKFPSKVNTEEPTKISRTQLLKWVANGEIPILIGTHALIQKSIQFQNLAYVIVDEQHRFGTEQRATLIRKDARVPHLLSMTATPIPRTLALTIYGDLDLTLLDEQPAGRTHPETKVVVPAEREKTYTEIKKRLAEGRQVYVICPRIEEPDPDKASALRVKSVTEETKRLQKNVFTEYSVGTLHGKMKPKEKESVMQQFAHKKIDVLVATSVVEVGVNVPNATVIVIEGAERFGLAQLHQLRGRVQRSTHQAYCYLFADTDTNKISGKTLERLKALTQAKNGFELAELDLQLRGAGELSGNKQWGVSDLGMEAIKNIKMVEAARTEAETLLKKDSELTAHPEIAKRLNATNESVHFE